MIKRPIIDAVILAGVVTGAQAQSFGLSGEYELNIEGGLAMPTNVSDRSLIVENNSSFTGGPAPWTVTPLVAADILDFGSIASFATELSAGLSSGGAVFLSAQGVSGQGSTDLAPHWEGLGAIPGSHDDGYLINSVWDPVAVVNTADFALTAGYSSIETAGLTWMAGVAHAVVAQDLIIDFDANPVIDGHVLVSGSSSNQMYGVTAGIGYQRVISNDWSLGVDTNVSALQNTYDYSFDYNNFEHNTNEQVGAVGISTVVRWDVAAKLAYTLNETTALSGSIGATSYTGIVSGLDTMLNEANTISAVSPVTSSVLLPYVRFGVSVSF